MITAQQVSIVVTASNLMALVPIYVVLQKMMTAPEYEWHWVVELTLLFLSMMASVLMHASETKHGLRGIEFGQFSLIRESQAFLWLDRVMTMATVLYILTAWLGLKLYNPRWEFWAIGLSGVVLMTISEHWAYTPRQFMTAHSLWHVMAFTALAILFA